MKKLRGCLVLVVLLGVAAYAGWRWGEPFFGEFFGERSVGVEEPVATPELAEATLARFESFRRGEAGDRLTLGSLEVESVLRYGVPQMVPTGVSAPSVRFRDGAVRVAGDVAVEDVPALPDLDGILGFLPDTLRIEVEGTLTPFTERPAALTVHRVSALGIPLPDRMIRDVLTAFGRADLDGLASDAMPVHLPTGLSSVYVLRDSLVLVHER